MNDNNISIIISYYESNKILLDPIHTDYQIIHKKYNKNNVI